MNPNVRITIEIELWYGDGPDQYKDFAQFVVAQNLFLDSLYRGALALPGAYKAQVAAEETTAPKAGFFAIDSYTDKPQRVFGPFPTREEAEAWCEKRSAIGHWGVDTARPKEAYDAE